MTGVHSRRISADIAVTFARQFLAGFLRLGTVWLIALTLGPEGAGSWSIAQLLPSTLGQLLNLGLVSANVYFIASRQFELQDVWAVSRDVFLAMSLVGSLFAAMLVTFAGDVTFPGVSAEDLRLVTCMFPLMLFNSLIAGVFQAKQDFRRYNVLTVAEPIVTLTGLLVYSFVAELSVTVAIGTSIVGHSAALLLGLLYLRREVRVLAPAHHRLRYLKPAMRYGILSHLGNLVTFLTYRVDIYLVNLILGPSATGVYSVAVKLAEQVWIVSSAVSTVIFPRLSSLRFDESDRDLLTATVARATLFASSAAAFMLIAVGGPLIGVVFGAEFNTASGVLALLLPGVVLLACARVLANDLAAQGKVAVNFYISVGLLAANTILALLMTPALGLTGASLASSLAYAMGLAAQLAIHSQTSSQLWWHSVLPQPQDGPWVRGLIAKWRDRNR